MFEVDNYLGKRFHLRNYNCWHFVRDIWEDITGERLYDFTPTTISDYDLRLAANEAQTRFVRVTEEHASRGPVLVLASSPFTTPHIGLVHGSKVLHLRASGALYESLEQFRIGFRDVSFYTTASRSL